MWERIKKILQKEGGKCIIIENDQPAYIVMSFDEYEKKKFVSDPVQKETESEFDKVNKDIAEWKAAEAEKNSDLVEPEESHQDVEIEDLPF